MVETKILHVNNYNYAKGGSDKYFIELLKRLNNKPGVIARSFATLNKQSIHDDLNLNKKIFVKDTKSVFSSLIFDFIISIQV